MSNISDYSPLVLAYIGDAYFELLVRERITANGDCNVSRLSSEAKKYVTAVAQSEAVERMLPCLTPDEETAYKRGRNAKSNHTPRSAGKAEYRRATGLEALFGWLFVKNELTRAKQIFDICYPKTEEDSI